MEMYFGHGNAFVPSARSLAVGAASLALCATALSEGSGFVPHRLLVKFKANVSSSRAKAAMEGIGAKLNFEIPGPGIKVVSLPAKASEVAMKRLIEGTGVVDFAELDEKRLPESNTPNDPWLPNEWHLNKISAPLAWNYSVGSASIVVAVLDTGVSAAEPDLSPKLVPGWNVFGGNSNTADVTGHGTDVAGVIGASTNNGVGVASVAGGCPIMPIRIGDSTGAATFSAMASGLNWAADHGARVANLSYDATGSSAVRTAAQYFQSKGGVVTVASGNNAKDLGVADNPYVLTVGATQPDDTLAPFSNFGTAVDLVAPGTTIMTTRMGGYYGNVSGTSFSAPVVAGVAALVLSANPSLSGSQAQDILRRSTDDLGSPGWDPYFGTGRINAYKALQAAVGGSIDTSPPSVSLLSPANGSTQSGVVSVWADASDNNAVDSVTFLLNGTQIAQCVTVPYKCDWDTSSLTNGTYTLTAVAKDFAGNVGQTTSTINVLNSGDTTAPTVAISSPVVGSKVGQSVSVQVNAADNVKVSKVELYVDGKLTATSTTAPFTTSWNTRKVVSGTHMLACKAYDAAGNSSLSGSVSVVK